jgi:hypothetical protein
MPFAPKATFIEERGMGMRTILIVAENGDGVEPEYKAIPPKKMRWLKTALKVVVAFLAFCVVFFIGISYFLMWYTSRPGSARVGACKDTLRTIDSAANEGKYPATIDDLVSTYIRYPVPRELMGGTYSLDASGERPEAVCSIHGGLENFDLQAKLPSPGYDWASYAVLVIVVTLMVLAVGIGVYTWKRNGSLLYGRSER